MSAPNLAHRKTHLSSAELAAVRALSTQRARRSARECAGWTPPTDDTVHLVRVAPGERTCTKCYETFAEGAHCERCGAVERVPGVLTVDYSKQPPSVPTTSYLHSDEYRIVG